MSTANVHRTRDAAARAVFLKYGITLRQLRAGTILDAVDNPTAYAALLELAQIFLPEPAPPKEE